jgi:hypothetical protein
VVDELAQARGGHGLADPDALGEVVEARRPVEGLAQDQERRARRDDVERPGDRAAIGAPRAARLQPARHVEDVVHGAHHSWLCLH